MDRGVAGRVGDGWDIGVVGREGEAGSGRQIRWINKSGR